MLDKLKHRKTAPPPEPVVYYGQARDFWPAVRPEYAEGHCWFCATCCENRGGYSSEADAERAARKHAATHSGVRVEREVPRHAGLG